MTNVINVKDSNTTTVLDELLVDNISPEDFTKRLFYFNYGTVLQRDPELAELMRACAIPGSFDSKIIGILRGTPKGYRKNNRILENLKTFSFVQTRKDGHYVYHDTTRDILMKDWRSGKNRKQYEIYVNRLVDFYTQQAERHYEKNNYTKALADYNRIAKLKPGDAHLYFMLGKIHYYLKDYKAALSDLKKAVRLRPKNGAFHHWLAATYLNLQDRKAAISHYGKAIKLEPLKGVYYLDRGWTYYELKNYKEALSNLTTAVKLEPKNKDNYLGRGVTYFALKNYKAAISDFNKAIDIDHNDPMLYRWRSATYFELKKYDLGLKDINKVMQIGEPTASDYYNRGGFFYQLGDYKSALSNITRSIKLNPNVSAYNARASVYSALAKFDKALSDLRMANKLNPQSADTYYVRARINYLMKKYKLAVGDLDSAINLDTGNSDCYFYRGLCHLSLGQADKALADINFVCEHGTEKPDSGKAPPIFWRGVAQDLRHKTKESRADWNKAAKLAKSDKNVCSRQRVLAKIELINDRKTARKHYTQSLKSCHFMALQNELGNLEQLTRLYPSKEHINDIKNWFEAQIEKKNRSKKA